MNDSLFKPSTIKELCEQYNLTPSKKYGQNYLVNPVPIEKMLEAADVTKKDTVIEVGPGFGVLTFALAEKAGQVIAFEIEQKLKPYWEEKQKEYDNIEIVWGNALHEISNQKSAIKNRYKVVANLPYQITSHALRSFFELPTPPECVVVMLQKEVAERVCAVPPNMSLLAVSVQYFGTPRKVTAVSRGNFWPSPKVDSTVVAVTDIVAQPDSNIFFRVVRAGFANKRKQLAKNLAIGLSLPRDVVDHAVENVTGNPKSRAQELTVEQWEALSHHVTFIT